MGFYDRVMVTETDVASNRCEGAKRQLMVENLSVVRDSQRRYERWRCRAPSVPDDEESRRHKRVSLVVDNLIQSMTPERFLLLTLFLFCFRGSEGWLNPSQIRRFATILSTQFASQWFPSTNRNGLSAAISQDDDDSPASYMVEVTYDGRSCSVPIRVNETLLSGLERNRVPDRLAIPELPSECRRGNCLTCVGKHRVESHETSLHRGGDGLSPEMSRQVSKLGYVLTCSSHVVGEGLKLELGQNQNAWEELYYQRLFKESTRYVARKAMARTIRRSDERNPARWAVETRNALEKSGDVNEQ